MRDLEPVAFCAHEIVFGGAVIQGGFACAAGKRAQQDARGHAGDTRQGAAARQGPCEIQDRPGKNRRRSPDASHVNEAKPPEQISVSQNGESCKVIGA